MANGEVMRGGVCYDTYGGPAMIQKHFEIIKTQFSAVRTYQTSLGPQKEFNVVDAAAAAGLALAAGIWLRGNPDMFALDLQVPILYPVHM